MPSDALMKDQITLVKKDGTVAKSGIPASVSSKQITTFDADLLIEVGDHIHRELPNGLVDDFVVIDPGYRSGLGPIRPHYQVKVRRSDSPPTRPQSITANFHGPNARMNVNSTDNSINVASEISSEQLIGLVEQVRSGMTLLPAEQQKAIMEPLAALDAELASSAPSQPKIRAVLRTIRTIAEGAAGNIVATGISGLIAKILSGG